MATAVFPTRFPVPITASDGNGTACSGGGSNRKSAPAYGSPSASARDAHRKRSRGPSTGSSERSTTISASDLVERVDERNAVFVSAAQLLRPADEERRDHVVRQHGERVPHDGRVVLAVDQDDRSHRDDVTSSSIRAVYFSKVFVSLENWMIRSCSWNGYLRQTSTCVPSTSTTL